MAVFEIPDALMLASPVRAVLEVLTRRHSTPQKLAQRAQLVLALAAGGTNPEVAARMGMHPTSVRSWRRRWLSQQARLEAFTAEPKTLARLVVEILDDRPRSGAPPTFTPEQVAAIVALACEPLEPDAPISHRSHRILAEEAVLRGVVASISPATVGRFFKSGGSQAAQVPPLAYQARRRSPGVR